MGLIGKPDQTVPTASVCSRIGVTRRVDASDFALLFSEGSWVSYEIRSGQLWARPVVAGFGSSLPFGPVGTPLPDQPWKRVGKRNDWISLWYMHGSIAGLTADGTVWVWGRNFGIEPTGTFRSRLEAVKMRWHSILGGPGSGWTGRDEYEFLAKPRALMRLESASVSE
jgi:hypothetical protein